jgi:hypothetical protein
MAEDNPMHQKNEPETHLYSEVKDLIEFWRKLDRGKSGVAGIYERRLPPKAARTNDSNLEEGKNDSEQKTEEEDFSIEVNFVSEASEAVDEELPKETMDDYEISENDRLLFDRRDEASGKSFSKSNVKVDALMDAQNDRNKQLQEMYGELTPDQAARHIKLFQIRFDELKETKRPNCCIKWWKSEKSYDEVSSLHTDDLLWANLHQIFVVDHVKQLQDLRNILRILDQPPGDDLIFLAYLVKRVLNIARKSRLPRLLFVNLSNFSVELDFSSEVTLKTKIPLDFIKDEKCVIHDSGTMNLTTLKMLTEIHMLHYFLHKHKFMLKNNLFKIEHILSHSDPKIARMYFKQMFAVIITDLCKLLEMEEKRTTSWIFWKTNAKIFVTNFSAIIGAVLFVYGVVIGLLRRHH